MPKFQLHPIRASVIILILFSLGFSIYSFANAWVEPGTTPPGGNVAAPLHTGTTSQTKQGFLTAYGVEGYYPGNGAYGALGYFGWGGYFNGGVYTNSYSYSTIMYDSNDGGYYSDPNGTSRLNYTVNNNVYSYGWMQAPIFYDANDNGYYVDPNSYSNLNRLNVSRDGMGECCSGGDYTLSLAEYTNRTGRRAGIQFHNGGESEGQLRLNPGPNGRELLAYSYQTDMDLRATGVVRGDQGLCIGGDCRGSWPTANLGDWYFSGDNLVSNGWGHIYTTSSNLHLDSYSGEIYLNYYYNNWVNVGNRNTGYLFVGDTQLYDNNDWFQIRSGANNRIYTNSYLRVDNNFEVQGNIYCASCGGWLSTLFNGVLRLNTWQGNHYSGSDGAEYATIFYDTNNSGYRVDPNSTSNINAQTSNSLSTGYLDFRYAGGNSGQGNNAYAIFQEGGSWSYPYPDLRIAYHTGIKLGANASYNGIRFYNDYDMSGLVMSVNDSGTGGANNVYIPNIAYVGDLRTTIMYDWNNTGYYVDPNGSSRLNQLYYVDRAYIVDLRPQYMYDWNDSNYYIDMNSGSRFNYLGRNYGWNWTEYDWNDTSYYMDLNNVSILNDLRVNILYDRQNTGYYVDPNSTSRMNYGVFDNIYSYSWIQAPIFYDANNTGYYVDPASTTVLNVVYANQYNCMSDINLKKDIKPISNALDKVLSIKGVNFTWKDEEMGTGNQVGVIAQDVEKVLPEVVTTNEQGLKAVDYSKLTPLIIESIKDLKIEKDQDVNNLREKIDNLEENERTKEEIINDLKRRIEALESK